VRRIALHNEYEEKRLGRGRRQFDRRSHMWWGTLGFMMIKGTTFLV
jgi:hypothetical protein